MNKRMMTEDKSEVEVGAAAEKLTWATPSLRRMRAGEAENAYTEAVDDGQFTRS